MHGVGALHTSTGTCFNYVYIHILIQISILISPHHIIIHNSHEHLGAHAWFLVWLEGVHMYSESDLV